MGSRIRGFMGSRAFIQNSPFHLIFGISLDPLNPRPLGTLFSGALEGDWIEK